MQGMSRRGLVQGLAGLGLGLWVGSRFKARAAGQGGSGRTTLLVGTQTGGGSQGVYAYHWDAVAGTLSQKRLAGQTPSPTFLALSPDHRYLFTANEVNSFQGQPTGGVSSFRLDAGAGKLTPINAVTSGGTGTCFVGVDPSGRTLLAANYTGGSAASFHIGPDGRLSKAVSEFHYTGHGPNADRQEAPHVHRAITSPSGKYALFCDLGLDMIHGYKLNAATGKLTGGETPAWRAPAGSGPRALRFHPNGHLAYCVTEMGASVVVLAWDEASGKFTTLQVVSLTPEGFTGRAQASDIVIEQEGRFAYAACRFYDKLATFRIDQNTGKLTLLARSTCGGKVPRDLTLDPSGRWLLVANQDSDNIAVIARDELSGQLSDTAKMIPLVKPQCLVFA